jgi:hypothetical protein
LRDHANHYHAIRTHLFLSCHLGTSNTINCYEQYIKRNELPPLGYGKTLWIEWYRFA